ncbi:copia protein, partial [Trifolium medium]|nr:copia protein [Trifolium medium]
NPVEDPSLYRSVVGALQYATLTRPEISVAVNKVCQFLSNPLEEHWKAVKRILRYLSGTLHHGLLLQAAPPSQPLSLIGFCDADWASDPDAEDLHQEHASILDQIWSLGGQRSRLWWPDLVLRQNIEV